MSRRAWVSIGLAAVLVLAGAGALGVNRARGSCGDAVTSLSAKQSSSKQSSSPFLDAAGRAEQPDVDRDKVVDSLGTAPPPFGPVMGAVGYHYEQWAQISAYAQGIGIRTRDNPDFTMLDDGGLEPLWSVQVDTDRSAYDANTDTYLVATMPKEGAPDLVVLDARTGARRWCASLGGPHVRAADPFATQLLDDGSVVVLGPGTHGRQRVVRLDRHGAEKWTEQVRAEKGDYLGLVGDGLLVAGGRPAYELSDPQKLRGGAGQDSASRLVALDLDSGRTAWRTPELLGSGSHVVGTDNGRVFVLQRSAGNGAGGGGSGGAEVLVAYDEQGAVAWSVLPDLPAPLDVALLGGRILVRQGTRIVAYSETGRMLWHRMLPAKPQLLPYGFQLDDVPLLDVDHALLGLTTGLRVLDLSTGHFTATARLPTDGINTTYWPYQVAVSDHLIAVATNTSAVVMSRR